MTDVPRFAIIPTHNRPAELARLISQIRADVDGVVIIDNASDPRVDVTYMFPSVDEEIGRLCEGHIICDDEQPPHLYRMWNEGLAEIESLAVARRYDAWDVAIFNDDAIVPAGWFDIVVNGLRRHDTVIASTGWCGPVAQEIVLRGPGEGGFTARMCSWAFVMRGESGLRADERFRWWYGDNDFDWQARVAGGVVLLPGPLVGNEHANTTTIGALAEQSGHDAEAFKQKWGRLP